MNKSLNKVWSIVTLSFLMVFAISCTEDNPPLPDNLINFEANELGFSGEQTATFKVNLSREEKNSLILNVSLAPVGVTYGVEFTTTPAAVNNVITLEIPAGETEASITVTKADGIFLDGDESISFTIQEAEPAVIGETLSLLLSFSPIVSNGSTLTLQGKTDVAAYANSVFVDLSANKQTQISRKGWALGFYTGTDFRVIINHSFQMLTTVSDKNDMNAVTIADAQASRLYNFNAFAVSADASALTLVDAWDGDLTKTAIASVSATDSENKVYFVRTEAGSLSDASTWYKIRVLRNSTGYTLQYAKVDATTFTSVNISKNSTHNYVFVSLDNGTDGQLATVEPVKTDWDIEWSYSTYLSSPSFNTPYWFRDFVLINYLAGAEAAQVVSADAGTSATAYANFNADGIAGLTFLRTRDAIGDKWRSTNPATGVKRDRFYVVRDPHGNVYKLKFNSSGIAGDGGERDRPVIEYTLVKKAA